MSSRRNPEARDEWESPAELVELVVSFAKALGFSSITLDPSTTKANPTGAQYIRTAECDPNGLETEWFERLDPKPRFVFVNPPYRAKWYKKIQAETATMPEDAHLVSLLPAKVGTGYLQDIAKTAAAVVFIRGRLTFAGATEPAPFESALVYHGSRRHAFLAHFEALGWAV